MEKEEERIKKGESRKPLRILLLCFIAWIVVFSYLFVFFLIPTMEILFDVSSILYSLLVERILVNITLGIFLLFLAYSLILVYKRKIDTKRFFIISLLTIVFFSLFAIILFTTVQLPIPKEVYFLPGITLILAVIWIFYFLFSKKIQDAVLERI